MTTKKTIYHKKLFSPEVFLLWEAWHNLKGPFTGWEKTTNSRSVRFESTYKMVKTRMVKVEYIVEQKVVVIIPPLSDRPETEFKIILLDNKRTGGIRNKIKNMIRPIVYRFIKRNY